MTVAAIALRSCQFTSDGGTGEYDLQYAARKTDKDDGFASATHLQASQNPKGNRDEGEIGENVHHVKIRPKGNEIDTFAVNKVPCMRKSTPKGKHKRRRKGP